MLSRQEFNEVYNAHIVGRGFFEAGDYYEIERGRYWRTLEFMQKLALPKPANVLEIGGGQIAVLRNKLFSDRCTVADISAEFSAPIVSQGIAHRIFNLLDSDLSPIDGSYNLIVLLEVIEHIPVPPYTVLERLKSLLAPNGTIFITTPNLFSIRNISRMIAARDFFDRFRIPEPGQPMGHQTEYSASHLAWQIERAGLKVTMLEHDQLERRGHSLKARMLRLLALPLFLRPKWRECLIASATRGD